jgi:hypothetical protein
MELLKTASFSLVNIIFSLYYLAWFKQYTCRMDIMNELYSLITEESNALIFYFMSVTSFG